MSLGILNNISALYAQNSLNSTQNSLQNTLQQLSSGSRINSGADDAAGLAVADGLHANEAALIQSSQNATAGIGLLQTADGALSQVTNLLDRAVTLATEASNGTLTGAQVSSANQEYQNILSQIGNIGATTNFNSSQVFSSNATNIVVTDGTTSGLNTYADIVGALTTASVGTTAAAAITSASIAPTTTAPTAAVGVGPGTYTFTPNAGTDLLSGNLTFTVGSGTAITVNVNTPSNVDGLASLLGNNTSFFAAGLTARSDGNSLIITGPQTGPSAAANTVSFVGTSLTDGVNASLLAPNTTPAVAPKSTMSSITFGSSAASGDVLSGTLTYQVAGGAQQTITLNPGTTLNSAGIVAQMNNDATFKAAGLTASLNTSGSTPVLTVKGLAGSTSGITLGLGTIADTTNPGVGIVNSAGTAARADSYTITGLASDTDTFGASATLSIASNAVVVAGLTGQQASDLIMGTSAITSLGITSNWNSSTNTLTITGKADGTTANAQKGGAFQNGTGGALTGTDTPGAAVVASKSTLTLAGSPSSNDVLSGTITYSVAGGVTSNQFIIPANTILASSGATSIVSELNADPSFSQAGLIASLSGTKLVISTTSTTLAPAVTVTAANLVDVTHPLETISNNTQTGALGSAAINTITLHSNTDIFGGGVTITSNGNSTPPYISLAGLNGQQAANLITNNTIMKAEGVTAVWDSTQSKLTITGNPDGSSLVVTPTNSLSDNAIINGATSTNPATGGPSAGATAVIALNNANDTLSGTLALQVGTTGMAKDNLTFKIEAGTTGAELASQLNSNANFQAAGVSAAFSNGTVTLTGPTGTANTLSLSNPNASTSLIDSSSATPQGGANFTTAAVSTLTAATASAVLTTVNAAVADVAYQRGTIGADINQLTSASNVTSSEGVNLTSAEESIRATNYGQAASDLAKYQILSQTGISALAQANSVQQEVLKLLQ
jgi:flagellin